MDAARERLSALDRFVAETGNTRIRPIRPADAEVLFGEVHERPAVTKWLCWEGPADPAEMSDRYQSWRRGLPSEPVLIFAIEDAKAGAAIGELTLRFDGHPGVGDLGYWLGEEQHGKGHGSAALSLAAQFAFEQLDARVLTASVKEGNLASIAILEGAGFRLDPAPGRALKPGLDRGTSIAWYASLTRRSWARIQAG